MSGPKHTPGPWEVAFLDRPKSEVGEYVQGCVDSSPGEEFWLILGVHPDGGLADVAHVGNGPTSEANARLIAAAPRLAEALADMLRCFAEFAVLTREHEVVDNARAALRDAGVDT